jgi:predicted phosphate transport protein (TIGR00153 family)
LLLDRIVSYLMPRENKFFIYLDSIAKHVEKGADTFAEMSTAKGPEDFEKIATRLRGIEHEGDELAHLLYEELDKTFVTPLDREDLHALCSALDNVLDFTESCAARIVIYRLSEFSQPMKDMTRIFREAAHEVSRCVHLLSDLSKMDEINVHIVHVNTLENEADKIYRAELARLFATPPKDVVDFIRTKEILDALERGVDAAEDVMDLMRSVCVKNG